MAQLTLGVDISDDLLSAVVVSGRAGDQRVAACAVVALEDHDDIPEMLPVLLEQLEFKEGRCVSGLPLSYLSLRNLILPFTNEKKIQQILPLEMEEHLLTPVGQQILATATSGEDADGTKLLVAAVERSTLARHLETFQESGLDPDIVCPAGVALAEILCAAGVEGRNFLLLYGDMGSMTMLICHQGMVVFMRRLSYPEKVFTDAIFSFDGSRIKIGDRDAADVAVSGLCAGVQRSIDYFRFSSGMDVQPDHVVLAGPMQLAEGFQKKIEDELGLVCKACDLQQAGVIGMSGNVALSWLPAVYDRALSLALKGGSKNVPFNFRRDEFAPKRHLLGSRRQATGLALAAGMLLVLIFGYLAVDHQSLKKKNDRLAGKMEQMFKKSFPETSRIVDPLVQMKSRLREAEAPTVSMPLFTSEKRVLAVLADVSGRVPAALTIHVSRLLIDQESVKIQGTTDAFNNVNTIKNVLSKSPRFAEVNIVSATKAKEKGAIRFEIRMQLRESS